MSGSPFIKELAKIYRETAPLDVFVETVRHDLRKQARLGARHVYVYGNGMDRENIQQLCAIFESEGFNVGNYGYSASIAWSTPTEDLK